MQNYNLIHSEPEDITNGDTVTGSGVLRSEFFEVTAGVPTVTIADLIGVNIFLLLRENAPYKQVSTLTAGRQFTFDSTTGDFVFPTDFNPNEQLLIAYYTGSSPVTQTEPLTVSEVKEYLRLQGFTDAEGSTSDFDTDDSLIQRFIVGARIYFEKLLGVSIVLKRLRVRVTNLAGEQDIPYGPVISVSSVKDCSGNAITNYVIEGGYWACIESPRSEKMKIEYLAGYMASTLTDDLEQLRIAMLQQIAWNYCNRGDVNEGFCEEAWVTASPFSRKPVLI